MSTPRYQKYGLDRNPGRLHQGTTRCVIGSMPISFEEEDSPTFEMINANITQVVDPGLSISYVDQFAYCARVQIPVSEEQTYGDGTFTITMIADDRMENYWAIHRYMDTIRSGFHDGFPDRNINSFVYGNDGFYRNRRTYIPFIEIHIADDSMQKHQITKFYHCFPTALSSITHTFDQPSAVKFTVTFSYIFKKIIRLNKPEFGRPINCIAR